MSPRGTTLRNVRVADELWSAAQETAARRDENLSEVIRRKLREYLDEPSETEPTAAKH